MTPLLMTDRDDFQLLHDYTETGSQPAFAELVHRQINLVYSSALRQVRDPHAAEDVTQTVFIILAKKARQISPPSVLSAWLLGVTRFAARDHLKRARRRRHYEHAAALERTAAMVSAQKSNSPEAHSTLTAAGESDKQSHQRLATVLDDALAKLRSSARDAMVLRFFQNQSFKQVGQHLGITELAARQRVFRALEQLCKILSSRGVSPGSESLAVALATTAVLPAPTPLSAAVAATATSLASAASYAAFVKGTVTLMKLSKAKTAALSILLLLLLAVGAGVIVMNWPRSEPRQIAVAEPSSGRTIAASTGRQGSRSLFDIVPPDNFAPPSFGWVVPYQPPPAMPPPPTGEPVTGIVLSPDGKPLAGAEVFLYGTTDLAPQQSPRRALPAIDNIARTNADGRFSLSGRFKPLGLFIQSPQGGAWISAESIKPQQSITLSRWSRLEMTVKQDGKPLSKRLLTYYPSGLGDSQIMGNPIFATDQDGHAAMEHVLPGEARITWNPEDSPKPARRNGRDDAATRLPPREMRITIEPGKTYKLALGGRPITGAIEGDLREFDYRRGVLHWKSPADEPDPRSGAIYFDARADGTFTVPDVPPGDHQLAIDLGISWGKNIKIVETCAVAAKTFKMPPIPGDGSLEPLDIGKVSISEKKLLEVEKPFPNLAGKTPNGEPLSLQDFKGKILFLEVAGAIDSRSRGEIDWQHAVYSRFAGNPAFAMLTVIAHQPAPGLDNPTVPWPVLRLDADRLPQELQGVGTRLYLLDVDQNLFAKNITAAQVYSVLDHALQAKPDPRVTYDFVERTAARQNPPFEKIPAPSAEDAAAGAFVAVIAGVPSWDTPKSTAAVLTDGRMLPNEDAPADALFFQAGTLEGRFRIDLKEITNVAEIRTYSWHKDTRAAQVFHVFASDGADKNFDLTPAIGTDPTKCGWKSIAFVDTRPDMKPVGVQYEAKGGRYVSVISDKEKGTLGTYRHLLFQVFVTEADDVFGHTFYGEIDVIPKL